MLPTLPIRAFRQRPSSARHWSAALALCALLAVAAAPASAITVIEYYNASLDHYFITPLADRDRRARFRPHRGLGAHRVRLRRLCNAGRGAGRRRQPGVPLLHSARARRLAFPFGVAGGMRRRSGERSRPIRTSAATSRRRPRSSTSRCPTPTTGACPAGTGPVYRLWNQRADSNHRYTADRATARRDDRARLRAGRLRPARRRDVHDARRHRRLAGARDRRVAVRAPDATALRRPASSIAGAEVEPYVAIDPQNASHLIGVWQQDRWSDGGARGLRTGYSFDGGLTWSLTQAAFSRCTGGNAANGGDFARASDPWVTIGPDGIAYQIAIAFNGDTFAASSSSAVLASRSTDGGRTWSDPATLIRDGSRAVQRQGIDHRRSRYAGVRVCDVGPPRPGRQRPGVVRAHDQRRTVVGSGASDLRSGRAQPDAQQPDRRDDERRRAHAVRLLHRIRLGRQH